MAKTTDGDPTGGVTPAQEALIAGAAQKAQDLADLDSAATARTNLGLGTAATTAATDYATAAQGATADTAVQPSTSPILAVTNMTGSAAGLDSDATAHAASNGGSHSLVASAVQPSTAPVLTGTNITGIPAAGVTGTAVVQADVGTAAALDVGTGAGDVAAGNKGVTNGDNHNHTGGAGATIPIAGLGLGGALKTKSIWDDTFNQSRNAAALASAGYTLNTPGSGTIVEDGTDLTITTPAAYNANWYNATRTCENIALTTTLTMGRNCLIYASVKFPAAVNQTGVGMVVEWDASNDWYRAAHTRASGSNNRDVIRGPTTVDYSASDGGAEGWIGMYLIGGYAYLVSLIQAWASGVPALADWDFLLPTGRATPTFRGGIFTVRLIAISYAPTPPGVAVNFGGLYIDQLY